MTFRLKILATAAILLPVAAGAQTVQPSTPATPQMTAPGQTETTPGQQQTTPGEASTVTPAVTGETPSGQTTGNAEAATTTTTATTKVTVADVKKGATIYDASGNSVGTVESVSAKGAVLDTGKVKVTIPLKGLAKSDKGLVVGMTKSEIEAAAKKS